MLKVVLRTADVYVSPALLAEYREVPEQLRSSGKVTTDQRQTLVSGIAAFVAEARVVVPTRSLALCRDPADDMLLEGCQAARRCCSHLYRYKNRYSESGSTMIEDNLALPFETAILGVAVIVERVEVNEANEIVAICRRGRERQAIPLVDLPLPSPDPSGHEWIAASRHWARGRSECAHRGFQPGTALAISF